MKGILVGVAAFGFQVGGAAGEPAWQRPEEVLRAIVPGQVPAKPQAWQSPRGPVVLHGDLFGDGRHVALVGTDETHFAVVKDGSWCLVATHEVGPAWLPRGKSAVEFGYTHFSAPEMPFVLKYLDGDRAPEVLVAFANDGHSLGFAIARKDGAGLEFLDLRSEQGEPEFADGMLEVVTETSGRKAWWSGTTYFRWQDGQPVAVATWVDDCRDDERPRWVAIRHDGKRKDRSFQIEHDGTGWVAREGRWESGAEVADAVAFATVRFRHAGEPDDGDFLTELMMMFELTTAVPANIRVLPPGNREGFDFHQQAAGLTFEVSGQGDARMLFKRVAREP